MGRCVAWYGGAHLGRIAFGVLLGFALPGCVTLNLQPRLDVQLGDAIERQLSPFGIHGPSYCHWVAEGKPHLWEEGTARLRIIRDSGARWVRQDFWWAQVEPQPGRWEWANFDRAVESYERAGVNVLAILCYGSAWGGGDSPTTPEERAAFGGYVHEMVKRYRGRIHAWEIWNEPNIQPFWSPRPDPALYAELLKVAYRAAKEADPNCVVVGGVTAGPDAAFVAGMYAHGAAGHFDVLSYHNYNQHADLDTEWPALKRLREIMAANGDAEKPIWHTENGFYTGPVGLSEEDQAARLMRYSLGLLGLGIERTFQLTVADWTDDPNSADRSVYRGLTRADYTPKLALRAYQVMAARVGMLRAQGIFRPAPGVTGILFGAPEGFSGGSADTLVVWRDWSAPRAPACLVLGVPVVLLQDLHGGWRIERSDSGVYEIEVGREPLYILAPGETIRQSATAVRWDDPLRSTTPRDPATPLQVTLDVVPPQGVSFRIGTGDPDDRESSVEIARLVVPAPGTYRVSLNTLGFEPGRHEVWWELAPLGGADALIIRGYRELDVLPPVRFGFDRFPRLDATAPAVPAFVEYAGAKPATGRLWVELDGRAVATQHEIELTPGAAVRTGVPLDLTAFEAGLPASVTLQLEIEEERYTIAAEKRLIACPPAPGAVRVDGDLSEWRTRPPQIRPEMMRWEYVNADDPPGPDDLSVTAWLAWDERGLWFAAEVRDDVLVLPQSRHVWDWDSVQIGLDLGSDAQQATPYDGNDLEIEVGANVGGPTWCYLGACPSGWPAEDLSDRLQCAVKVDEAGGILTYEVHVPADLLVSVLKLEPDTVLGFSFLVNDNDGAGRAGWQELTPGIGMGKQPEHFAWLWLRPDE